MLQAFFKIFLVIFVRMKKAQLIPIDQKKDAQVLEDIELGPLGRFHKMFDLIELSIFFSREKKISPSPKPNAFTLKRLE
jgi:hypothetical protein